MDPNLDLPKESDLSKDPDLTDIQKYASKSILTEECHHFSQTQYKDALG